MRFLLRSLAVLLISPGIPVFAQDLTIVSKMTRDGGPPEAKISYISSDHARISMGDGNDVIVDFKIGQISTLDAKKKTYYVTTRADLDALAAKMQEQMNSPEMKKAQEQMKNLPPEARSRMEAMGGMFAVEAQDVGTTRKIAGYTCENWKMTMGQFSRSEECLTSELKFPPQAWEMYRAFADSMKSMMASFGPMAAKVAEMQEQLKKMKGFPLANTTTTEIMGHRSVIASEVTEVKQGSIPASAWEIPAGYTKVDNPMLKALQSRSGR
jgi:hypothetical protein